VSHGPHAWIGVVALMAIVYGPPLVYILIVNLRDRS
jgi:hypothetical protein